MGRKYRLYQVDAFTREKFAGNPAGVVSNADGLSEHQMQQIARELNNSETAFIFSSNSPDYDVHIRFFTPRTEVPISGTPL
jgi:PhzF family phenazine biosynthesis protein